MIVIGLFKVYQTELEKVQEFSGFEDFITSFPVYRGRAKSREEEEDTVVGEFKVRQLFILLELFPVYSRFQPRRKPQQDVNWPKR